MTGTNTILENGPLPVDLRQWISEDHLIHLTLEAVQDADWNDCAAPKAGSLNNPQARMLLTLLCYCYATGTFGSREIEHLIQSDRTVRYLCAHREPEWDSIRVFRRHHAAQVTRCLARLLESAFAQKQTDDPDALNEATSYAGHSLNRWQPAGRLDFRKAAEVRVARGVQTDSMEMDE